MLLDGASLLKNESYITQFIAEFQVFAEINVGSVKHPRILWDAIKGFIKSNTILFCSNARKARSHQLKTLEAEFTRLDSLLQINFTNQIALERSLVKKEINNILKQKSEFLIHRTRQRYYFQGARPSHLLAMRIRTCDHFADIPGIKSSDGNIRMDPADINKTFQTFFFNLYESEVTVDKTHCDGWLSQLDLPQLSVEESADFSTELMLQKTVRHLRHFFLLMQ